MSTNILMPALSPTMTEGKLSRWLKKEGEEVKSGDVLAEIETDKATMEVEAIDEGVLAKIVVPDGTDAVAVNAVIGIMTEEGEAAPEAAAATAAEAKAPAKEASGAPQEAPTPVPNATKFKDAPFTETKPATANGAAPAAEDHGERVFASPLARRMAKQAGIDLASLKGSGPNGRIVRADVDKTGGVEAETAKPEAVKPEAMTAEPVKAEAGKPEATKPEAGKPEAPKPEAAAPATGPKTAPPKPSQAIAAPHQKFPNSSIRKVIARRLTESKQTVPHFYLNANFDIDALLKLRAELNGKSAKDGPGAFKLSVNDLVIKACAVALRRHPKVNASYTEEAIIQYDDVDISIAVAIPDGLITPIVRRADQLGLAAISNKMKDLGLRAKAGKLKPDEYQGGGFSISNLGMYGIPDFSAIINPPQSAILAVGAGEKRAVVKNDAIVIATMMTVTMSVDHRVVDGALGAEFLATLKTIIEEPLSLML